MTKFIEAAKELMVSQSIHTYLFFIGLSCLFAGAWLATNLGVSLMLVGSIVLYVSLFYRWVNK